MRSSRSGVSETAEAAPIGSCGSSDSRSRRIASRERSAALSWTFRRLTSSVIDWMRPKKSCVCVEATFMFFSLNSFRRFSASVSLDS